ncbi:hypothetical protein BRADI_5g22353v3 [Brachypodium distachyon]|uniref:Endonuclease/exonuclease/phosphatase domain-containing protein n=1 Tax=Brachypodium distachyon TaxID=15368 RepID=A0A2K2CIN3_BRADI|nr:hypothetical protein BRADI_5g22353v3 [Brachypodium distachyon]
MCDEIRFLCWNVRGLNNPARCAAVRAMVQDSRATVVCLQETKLQQVSAQDIAGLLGPDFADNFSFLPANGSRGGIILAASNRFFCLYNFSLTPNTISATISWSADGTCWRLTGVYGPQGEAQKTEFIRELRELASSQGQNWLVLGDFNLIYRAADKNNNLLNRRLMDRFKHALNRLSLRKLCLSGRRFTWLDIAQESRALSPAERNLHASMKHKFAGLAAIAKSRA